jgi:hypothetical protein
MVVRAARASAVSVVDFTPATPITTPAKTTSPPAASTYDLTGIEFASLPDAILDVLNSGMDPQEQARCWNRLE